MKKIGIPAYLGKELAGVGIAYLDWISNYGTPRIILPQEEYVDDIDMLFLTGGPDASPSLYNEVPGFYTGQSCTFREYFFKERLKNYIGRKSIFGTCLGFQYINIFFGGKLEQNISHWVNKDSEHELYTMDGKPITTKDGKKPEPIMFNSSHHQGFKEKQLGEGLTPLAQSCEGYIERIINKDLKIAGTQYHPERQWDAWSDGIIKEFLK